MNIYINRIGTAVPENAIPQEKIWAFMTENMAETEEEKRKLSALFRMSGIRKRHSVIADYGAKDTDFSFYPTDMKTGHFPTTAERMKLYQEEALPLSIAAIRDLGVSLRDLRNITHLITVSCTGMYAPGLDIGLIKALHLPSTIERTGIQFMGCYAAFNGLKAAKQIIGSQPDAKVLLVCTELCSIHFQQKPSDDNLLANTLFADGAAAVWLSAEPEDGALQLTAQYCDLLLEGEGDMAWHIGDFGFEMKLTTYIPQLLEQGIHNLSTILFKKLLNGLEADFYAIHPGGKRILQSVKKALALSDDDMRFSNEVLAEYGNMSSPTILFVLKQIMQEAKATQHILAFAFGPGLTLESMVFQKH